MPSLPGYSAQRNIRAGKSQPLRRDVAAEYKIDKQVIGAIQGVTQQWSDAHDVMQYTEAKGKYEVGVANILSTASADPDYKGSDKYFRDLEDIKKSSTEGISNKAIMEKLSTEMDFGNQMAGIKLENNFRQKEIIANRFQLTQSIEGLQQKKLQSEGPEALEYDSQISELLSASVASGVISQADAEKIKDDANKISAEFDATVNPEKFIANGSKYYGIPEDEYKKLKESARLSKDRAKKESIEALDELQETTEAQLIIDLADKKIDRLSVPDITKKIMNGEISREFGDAYIRVLKSAKHIDKKKKIERSGFTKYAQELFKTDDPDAVRKAVIRMLDGAAEGELNEEQLAVLIKAAEKAGKNKGWIAGAIDGLVSLGDTVGGFVPQEMTFNFFKNMVEGKDPEEAKELAIESEQIRTNPNRTKYSIGDTVDTPIGTMYVWGYYEDGEPDVRKEKPRK